MDPINNITIEGSTSMQPLVKGLIKEFQKKYPEANIGLKNSNSKLGIYAVNKKKAEIGMASAFLNGEGLDTFELSKEHVNIIVHPFNIVESLTIEEIRDIFSGKITNWKYVGGEDAKIAVVTREEGSGTREIFSKIYMIDKANPTHIKKSADSVKETIANNEYAIGYVSSISLDAEVKPLEVDTSSADEKFERTLLYQPLMFVTAKNIKGLTKKFIDFAINEEGKKVINEFKTRIIFMAVGDIMLDGDLTRVMKEQENYKYPFQEVSKILENSDLTFGNLECTLSNICRPLPNKINILCAMPNSGEGLTYAEFDILSLANNHSLDYGDKSLFETINLLQKNGINYVGAGKNLKESREPKILEIKNIRISCLAYSSSSIGTVIATKSRAGCAPLKLSIIEKDIKNAQKKADIIIISLHWGFEFYHYPSPDQIKIAHRIIEMGANMILSHHAHVVQGIEFYKKGLIVYCLGHFVFADIHFSDGSIYHLSEEDRESFIVRCELSKKNIINVKLIPTYINEMYKTIILTNKRKKQLLSKVYSLSKKYQDPHYERIWRAVRKQMLFEHGFLNNKIRKYKGRKVELLKSLSKIRFTHVKQGMDEILIKLGFKK